MLLWCSKRAGVEFMRAVSRTAAFGNKGRTRGLFSPHLRLPAVRLMLASSQGSRHRSSERFLRVGQGAVSEVKIGAAYRGGIA